MLGKNDELLDYLVKLESQKKCITRNLNTHYYNEKVRSCLFVKLNIIKKEIEKTKFKLRLERGIRKNDGNSNTNCTKN